LLLFLEKPGPRSLNLGEVIVMVLGTTQVVLVAKEIEGHWLPLAPSCEFICDD
jgi:hypothetical protein